MSLRPVPLLILLMLTAACSKRENVAEGGLYITRSACPIVGVPAATGDITLFDPPGSRDASAIDVTATMTNVFGNCNDASGDRILSNVGFDVVAVRRDAGPARRVVLPYFNVALQGGTQIVSKRVGYIALDFAQGSQRAQARGQAVVRVSRAAASIPADVRATLNRRRRTGDVDAAIDPMSDPAVRTAVARATFEHLVGFQMTQEQLRYNATR